MKIKLPDNFKLSPVQQYIFDHPARYKTIALSRRCGKTTLGIYCCLREIVKPNSSILWFAPTYKTLKPAILEMEKFFKPLFKEYNKTDKMMHFKNGSVLEFQSCEGDIVGRGREAHLAILDECAFIPNLLQRWSEIEPALTGTIYGKALFLSTPLGCNDFFRIYKNDPYAPNIDYYKLYIEGEDLIKPRESKWDGGEWKSFLAPSCTNPYLNKTDVIKNLEKCRNSILARQEYLSMFIADNNSPFAEKSMNAILLPLSTKPAKVWAADLASNLDYTVVIGLDEDMKLCFYDKFQGNWVDVKNRILSISGKETPLIIDETGCGRPVLHEMQRVQSNITGFWFSQQSRKDLMDLLVQRINSCATSINQEIYNELRNFEIVTVGNSQKICCPDHKHDDSVMALAMALFHYKNRVGKKNIGAYIKPEIKKEKETSEMNWKERNEYEKKQKEEKKPIDTSKVQQDNFKRLLNQGPYRR